MKAQKRFLTYLGYKMWKLNHNQSLEFVKNHYFLNLFLQGYIRLQIEKSYLYMTQDEREA